MSLRHSCFTAGRYAKSFFRSSFQPASSPTLNLGSARSSVCHHQIQTRFDSSSSSSSSKIAVLTPPWQFEDLSSPERRAFERWGPSYWEHMTPEQQEFARQMAEKRAQRAAEMEKEFGSDWYAIMREATALKDQQEAAQQKEELDNAKLYRKKDVKAKKELRRQFFDEQKATKADRLREAMWEVARNRARF